MQRFTDFDMHPFGGKKKPTTNKPNSLFKGACTFGGYIYEFKRVTRMEVLLNER
jgi:hypothetical protein